MHTKRGEQCRTKSLAVLKSEETAKNRRKIGES
jgi:hypothetical protein